MVKAGPTHMVYLDAFLEKRMNAPYNYVWTLREGAKQAGLEDSIVFVCGNNNGNSRAQTSTLALDAAGMVKRDTPPKALPFYKRKDNFFFKCYKTFFDKEAKTRLLNHARFLIGIDDMSLAFGRVDPCLDTVHSIHVFSTVDALRMHNYLMHIHKRHKIKLVLSFYTPGAPSLEWVRGYLIEGFFEFATRKLKQAHHDADVEAIRAADILVFPSPESLEAYHQEFEGLAPLLKHKDIRYVPYGADPLRPTRDKQELRALFPFKDKFVVSFVGHHSAIKGYDRLKRVGQKLLDTLPDIAFLIGGSQAPLVGLDHPRWFECGFTREMDNLIEAGDVFIAPNQQVFFDPVVAEALSRGKLVVATRVGGNKVFENASPGLKLFSTDDELQAVLTAFRNASASERESMGAINRELYVNTFTPKNFALAYNQMVRDVHHTYRLAGSDSVVPLIQEARRPEISVVIPVYNVENYLEECLTSVLGQTFKDIEVIAVNDGSTDNSAQILARFAAKDSRLRVITKPNGGMATARNAGLDVARGNYIAQVDSDDLIEPTMLERLYECCRENDLKMATCAFSFYDGKTGKTYFHPTFTSREHMQKFVEDGIIDLSDHRAIGHMFMVVWNVLYHRSIFDNVRYHQSYDDVATSVEILVQQEKVGYIPEPLYYYRLENPGRIVKDTSGRVFHIFKIMDLVKSTLYDAMDRHEAAEIYGHIAVEAIRYRSTLTVSSKAMYLAFWRRSNRFFRQQGLDFGALMALRHANTSEEDMLAFYRPYVWQRLMVKLNFRWRSSLKYWAFFFLESALLQQRETIQKLQSIEALLQERLDAKPGEETDDAAKADDDDDDLALDALRSSAKLLYADNKPRK